MDSRCRLCAEVKPLNDIECTVKDRRTNVRQMLMDCCRWATFEASEYDNLPKIVCTRCFNRLKSCWRFANSVADAQQRLLDHWHDVSIEATKVDHTGAALVEDDATCVAFEFKMDVGDICYDVAGNASTKESKSDADDGHDSTESQRDRRPLLDANDSDSESDAARIAAIRGPEDFAPPSVLRDKTYKILEHVRNEECNADGTIAPNGVARLRLADWTIVKYRCYLCQTILATSSELRRHMRDDHCNHESKYLCQFCRKPLASRRSKALPSHVQQVHLPYLDHWYVPNTHSIRQ